MPSHQRSRRSSRKSNSLKKRSRSLKHSSKKRSHRSKPKKLTVSPTRRSRKWHASIKKNWGKKFHDKLERCVKEVKKKTSKNPVYSPYAICFASLKGTTKHSKGSRKSRK